MAHPLQQNSMDSKTSTSYYENKLTESTDSNKSKTHFCGRGIAAALMIVPQIIMNIGLGALKGLQVGTFKPGEFMNRHAKRIGTEGGKLSKFCGHLGTFAGVIVGIAVAVPSLLIGVVGGLIRGIYKTPNAVKTCFNHGCSEAVKQTTSAYHLNKRKIFVIAAATFIIASTAFLLMPIALVSAPPLAIAFDVASTALLAACGAALTYIVATHESTNPKETTNQQNNIVLEGGNNSDESNDQ
jgi:hypothetical protein